MTALKPDHSQIYHVVLIEQEPIARRRIQQNLTRAGYRVEIARSLEKGSNLIEKATPALILLDWDLPDSDRFLQRLQVRPKLANTFITCLGHRTNVTERVQALNSGADEFLSKPIVETELLAKVKAGLRIHQLQKDLTQRNQTLRAELEEATRYMRSQLPAPMAHPITIDFRFIPSQHLGGDCFDYFWISDQALALYLLDVSGHGMGATLMAISVLNDIRQQSHGINLHNPAQVLELLNQRIQMDEQHSKYLTIWYGVYELDQAQLTYASAGHPPALLTSGAGSQANAQALKTPGMPIGLFPDSQYQNA
ncbi:MAG: SpoIIE family protein phosphatase, partial [Cyanobacteria bacterium P01_F01_bin.42]